MFTFLRKKFKSFLNQPNQKGSNQANSDQQIPVSKNLPKNLNLIKDITGNSNDLKIHEFSFGKRDYQAALIFIDGLVNSETISQTILKPILESDCLNSDLESFNDLNFLKTRILRSGETDKTADLMALIRGIFSGDTILICQGFEEGLIINTKGWEKRSISEPQTEPVIRGPREGFTENFRTNTALLRRRIKDPSLRMENMIIGRKSHTDICIAYIHDIVNPAVLETLRYRLANVDIDSLLDAGNLEQYIEDSPLSLFTTIGYSEKPDVVSARILEGRIGIIVDGSPFVLTVPMLFMESFQMSEDYYVRPIYASITRLLRYLAYFVAISAPAVYISLVTFHQELIPTSLLLTIANAKAAVPFPVLVEALIMVISFEILREAGLRLPRPVGQAMSIVGALIMGEAAVSAGVVSAPMVITVGATAVASFVTPEQNDSASILRLFLMIAAAIMGGYGVAIGHLAILIHLASLKSFGIAYLTPFAPLNKHDLGDSLIRLPLWLMNRRPESIAKNNLTRRKYLFPPPEANKQNNEGN